MLIIYGNIKFENILVMIYINGERFFIVYLMNFGCVWKGIEENFIDGVSGILGFMFLE